MADLNPPLGQGTAGLTDLVTVLQGILRQLSSANQNTLTLIAAVQNRAAQSYTVATLPSSPAFGTIAAVTDGGAAIAWGSAVTGGGSTRYLVFWNSAAWTVIGK